MPDQDFVYLKIAAELMGMARALPVGIDLINPALRKYLINHFSEPEWAHVTPSHMQIAFRIGHWADVNPSEKVYDPAFSPVPLNNRKETVL